MNDLSVTTHDIDGFSSRLRPWIWDLELIQDIDREYIMFGVLNGFKIVSDDTLIVPYEVENYHSADCNNNKYFMDDMILEDIRFGKISQVDVKPTCIHAYGAVPKKDTSELRPITDCSRPYGISVNDFIMYPSLKYNTVDSAMRLMSPNSYFALVDIRKAYRAVPVFPDHRRLLGLKWSMGVPLDPTKYKYYHENVLCFGLSCAPGIFTRLSNAIVRMMARKGFNQIVNYLDDFLIIGESLNECSLALQTLLHLLIKLGFDISWHKIVGPAKEITFLGIILDSVGMEARLPMSKLNKLRECLEIFSVKQKCRKKDLQRLAGLMAHCSTVVKGGRCFSRRIIDLVNSVKRQNHFIRLNVQFHKDVHWWINFSELFNGKAKIVDNVSMPISTFQTDASFLGFGSYFDGDWFAGNWHNSLSSNVSFSGLSHHVELSNVPTELHKNINFLELYPVLLAARRWGPQWVNKRVVVYTDNTQTKCFVNSGTCKNMYAMEWLRELFWLSAKYNFHLSSRYLKGRDNVIADLLSRVSNGDTFDKLLVYVKDRGIPFFV